MKKIFLSLFLLSIANIYATAQGKYGHLNFGNLISSMPETKAANSELEAYQKQLVAKGEEMATAFRAKLEEFYQNVSQGTMAPAEQQKQEAALQKEQQEIAAYEQEVVQKVQQKRNELIQPIVEKAENAIQEYGDENGYILIFDTSIPNAILFAEQTDDLMPAIKAKLGIN